jgi:uncharacterized protein (TIGR02757 family)
LSPKNYDFSILSELKRLFESLAFAAMSKTRISRAEVFDLLETMVDRFNGKAFIEHDPVTIPHGFSKKQDIEVAGLFAAVLAWGQRVTIIRKTRELMAMMDDAPYEFIVHHTAKDLRSVMNFKHRTFNTIDTLYFIRFLKWFYAGHKSLEDAFISSRLTTDQNVEAGLVHFHNLFFSLDDAPGRTRKHISTPERKSTCKRLNMFLRWMVRSDDRGVDFGIWKRISPAQLVCPCDVHVDRVARQLRLIKRKQTDWLTALELTENLKSFDPIDPVKYDFALFSMGVENLKPSRRLDNH